MKSVVFRINNVFSSTSEQTTVEVTTRCLP